MLYVPNSGSEREGERDTEREGGREADRKTEKQRDTEDADWKNSVEVNDK